MVAVVRYHSQLSAPRLGLCSNFLARCCRPGVDRVPIWARPGAFDFGATGAEEPLIMVGPGTGVAPFRLGGHLEEGEGEGEEGGATTACP